MANRKVTVRVDLQGGGNLTQTAQQATAQVAKLQSAVKGVQAGVPVTHAPGAAQQAAAQITAAPAPLAGLLATKSAAQSVSKKWDDLTKAMSPRKFNWGDLAAGMSPKVVAPSAQSLITQKLTEASQLKATEAEQKLAYLRTGPGQQATIRATRAEQELAKQQDYLTSVAKRGRAGAAVDRFAESVRPGLATARNVGAVASVAMYGGIASVSPEAGSQITNSFRMIANEIGIATIPAATRFTSVLQGVSRAIRTANEATHGWAGNVAFGGAMVLTSAGILSMGINAVQRGVQGLQWAGIIGQGAASAGGQVAGGALGRIGTGAGGAAAGGGAMALGAAPLTMAAGIAAAALTLTGFGYGAYRGATRPVEEGHGRAYTFARETLSLGGYNPFTWGYTQMFGDPGRPEGGPADVSERNPRMYADSDALEAALNMRAQAQPGPLAEQEARAMSEFVSALTSAVPALTAIGVQGNFVPQADENG